MKKAEENFTVFDFETKFQTRDHILCIKHSETDKISSSISNNKISVSIPNSLEISDNEIQNYIRKAIERAWKKEAKSYLPFRVKELAEQYNFKFKNVTIKNSKTRWGSCSSNNNINLNINLINLPLKLIDYVILHELVHTVEKNHSTNFWNLLNTYLPNAKNLNRELNKYAL